VETYINIHVVECCLSNNVISALKFRKASFVEADVAEDDRLVGAAAHHLNARFGSCNSSCLLEIQIIFLCYCIVCQKVKILV
jgi:hypothetical protein